MASDDMDTIDRVVMIASGALLLTGIVLAGIVEILAGKPYGAAPLTNDAGEVIAQPAIDPSIRTGLVVLALAVLGLWAAYKLLAPLVGVTDAPAPDRRTAD